MSTAKKNTVTIEASDAKYLADAMLAAASKDDMTPTICAARFSVEGDGLRGVATDRYRMHTALVPTVGKAKAHEFTIPREALLWLSKNANAFSTRGYTSFNPVVILTTSEPDKADGHDEGFLQITIQHDKDDDSRQVSYVGVLVRGNFPPVMTLVEKTRAAEDGEPSVNLNLNFLSSLRALNADRYSTPRVRFTKSASGSKKPGPVHVEFKTGGKVYAEAIIQPNLIEQS